MITDWQILNGLKTQLKTNLPSYFIETDPTLVALTDNQIVIDDYDIDNLPANVSVFIVPGYEDNERETIYADQSSFSVELYFICKGKDRATLVKQSQLYKASIEKMLGSDNTLGGIVDFSRVKSSKFYAGVDNIGIAKGFKLDIEFIYHKIFN